MISAVVMVAGEGATGGAASWVRGARRAAAADLLQMLSRQPLVSQVILVSPEAGELADLPMTHFVTSNGGIVHVGETLAQIVQMFAITHLLYLGGGAAPLLSDEALGDVLQRLVRADEMVITNNQFASDWLALTPAAILQQFVPRLPRDNMLGWVLSTEAGLPLDALPASAATRLDIDTPLDLLALQLHPHLRPHLRHYLSRLSLPTERLQAALDVLATPASQVFISGRLAPDVWSAVNRVTRSWLRVVSEERGMVSSGRQARGEVRSLLAAHIEVVGLDPFFAMLGEWAGAAFIDTRVLLAHHGLWPDDASRFASDLGKIERIEDDWLRAFTLAAQEATIPVVLGGHGLMSGAMLAFCDILGAGASW
ncbi:MAG TPA: hypothetical protein VE553_04840 [Candidatus Binatia bacterium]|nr:hypothetical protein [Candidatus Binatia bacterium]